MRANRLAGHILPNEGRLNAGRTAEGRAQCSCGATSEVLPSASARRRWHREEHKERVRECGVDRFALYPASVEQVAGLFAALEADVAWQRQMYGNSSDPAEKSAVGRLIGMEDALRTVREHLTPKAAS
jgi:hypothetical protein